MAKGTNYGAVDSPAGPSVAAKLGPGGPSMATKIAINGPGGPIFGGTIDGVTGPIRIGRLNLTMIP